MIRAGNFTINDQGFAASVERLGGTSREVLVLELSGGIPDEALEAICNGPIEVLDESGAVVRTHPGPFRVASHSVRFARASSEGDVAALTAHVAHLEAELSEAKSAKDSALEDLASLNAKFQELKEGVASAAESGEVSALKDLGSKLTGSGGVKETTPVIGKGEVVDAADSVQK